jgi:hypothetical protein
VGVPQIDFFTQSQEEIVFEKLFQVQKDSRSIFLEVVVKNTVS